MTNITKQPPAAPAQSHPQLLFFVAGNMGVPVSAACLLSCLFTSSLISVISFVGVTTSDGMITGSMISSFFICFLCLADFFLCLLLPCTILLFELVLMYIHFVHGRQQRRLMLMRTATVCHLMLHASCRVIHPLPIILPPGLLYCLLLSHLILITFFQYSPKVFCSFLTIDSCTHLFCYL